MFDVYALALPRGHGFGDRPPVEAWQSADGRAFAAITRDVTTAVFGALALRRRVDQVWTIVCDVASVGDLAASRMRIEPILADGLPLEPMPSNVAPRPALYNLRGREPSQIFQSLGYPSHHVAAWMLNQLYLSLPAPDRNWAGDCQTKNFHTRLWEAQLLASFREQGLLVTQPHRSPDFHIANRLGGEAWVEAVTANPAEPYEHVNADPSSPPADAEELLIGPAAVRFAKTLGNKLDRRYDLLPHVAGKPLAIALADFHAPGSMVWSREALISYLYGTIAQLIEIDGRRQGVSRNITHLLGHSAFPAGLFKNDARAELSAVIFTNACSLAKFSRVGVSAGAAAKGLRYVRVGKFFDRDEAAFEGIPFCLDITSGAYRALWPQGYEPWNAELEVFHNPFARHPLPRALLPEASHWFERSGEIICEAHYETSILWSRTLIDDAATPMRKLSDFLEQGKTQLPAFDKGQSTGDEL